MKFYHFFLFPKLEMAFFNNTKLIYCIVFKHIFQWFLLKCNNGEKVDGSISLDELRKYQVKKAL